MTDRTPPERTPDRETRNQDTASAIATFARYAAIGFTLPAATFTGYLIGYGLDHLFATRFLRIVFLLLGTAGGLIQVVRGLTTDRP
jgi:F0F1-type ATP synthase assembly protein I